jgi:deoxyadenosine/deoxycytidine kinase
MACRVKEHLREQQNKHPYRLFERSIYSGHYCFAHNSYQSGGMNSLEWDIYKQWFSFLMKGKCKLPTGFIYLKTDPAICQERIKKRNRPGEENISIDYLNCIHKAHDDFLIDKKGLSPELQNVPVLTLDGNKPFISSKSLFNQYCDQIEEFMHMTHLSSSEFDLESPADSTAF